MVALVGLIGMLGTTTSAKAQVVNGSFETGDFTGWTLNNGLGAVVTTADSKNPTDGVFFAHLDAGNGAYVYTTLSQTFNATAGDIISGDAYFQANDYIPYNDDAYVQILQGNVVLFSSDVAAVGDFGNTPWTAFSYQFAAGGSYTIEAGVRNVLDNGLSSSMGLDNVRISSSSVTPEGSSLAMFALGGLPLAVGFGRKFRRKTS